MDVFLTLTLYCSKRARYIAVVSDFAFICVVDLRNWLACTRPTVMRLCMESYELQKRILNSNIRFIDSCLVITIATGNSSCLVGRYLHATVLLCITSFLQMDVQLD